MQECTNRIEKNSQDIRSLLDEYKILKHENISLKERISKIELNQLTNNVIITGVPKQQWEPYEVTKQHVLDTVATSIRSKSDDERQQNVLNVNQININYCTRVGRFRPNQNRPISVTFQNREDKDLLMSGKSNLPPGLYVNHEYPPHVKKNHDHPQPILHLAKSIPSLKDKCKLVDDSLILNGSKYTVDNILSLPEEVAAYKAAQKSNETHIAFYGEFRPYSNFHPCQFTVNHHTFHCSEQFIQYQKALMFSDSTMANEILKCETTIDAKRLGYKLNEFDMKRWSADGCSICLDGIREKFVQNPNLLCMLKATAPKLLTEASSDRLWQTVVDLWDHQCLNQDKWYSTGWMSAILADIQDTN